MPNERRSYAIMSASGQFSAAFKVLPVLDYPTTPLGFLSMAMQAAFFSWVFPKLFTSPDWLWNGLQFALIFGLVGWSFMVLPIAELSLILVIPFGGLSRTEIVGRSSWQPNVSSSSGEPTVLVFGYAERVVLQLGRAEFQVSLNACSCGETSESLCGHCRRCNACRMTWSENWPPTLRDQPQ